MTWLKYKSNYLNRVTMETAVIMNFLMMLSEQNIPTLLFCKNMLH